MRKIFFIYIIVILQITNVFSQIKNIGVLPYVKNYTVEEYKGSSQVWTAIQGKNGIIYFGNNDGILQFDGSNWQKISVTNQIVTSLNMDTSGVIYVGGKSELGYLSPNVAGVLKYNTLMKKIPNSLKKDGNIWDIFITKNDGIIFHSYYAIYIYKNDTFNVLNTEKDELFARVFYVNNKIYVHCKTKGVAVLNEGKLELLKNSEIFALEMIRGILERNNKLIFVTWSKGIFEYDGTNFLKLETPIDKFITTNVNQIIQIKNNYIAFGLLKGLLITDLNFNPIQYFNSDCGLQSDAIKNLFLDKQDNIWLCLENGISVIPLFSPFTKFGETYGLGDCCTLSARKFENTFYIATSKGVFYKNWEILEDKINGFEQFKPIKNKEGNIKTFYIDTVQNKIITTSELGLFAIENNEANYMVNNRTIRTFFNPKSDKNKLIGGSEVLLLFEKVKNNWIFKQNIVNFNEYSRYLQEDDYGNVWMSNSIKGIFKIKFNATYDSVVSYVLYDSINGLHGLPSHQKNYVYNSSLGILFATCEGIYRYNYKVDNFEPFTELNKVLGEKTPVVMLYEDLKKNIWYKNEIVDKTGTTNWELGELMKTDSGFVLNKTPFYKYRNQIFSFDCIDSNTYAIGAEHGFIYYDVTIVKDYNIDYSALIRKVELIKNDSIIFGGVFTNQKSEILDKQDNKQIIEINFENNNLRFSFSADFYEEPENTKFMYMLEGNDTKWSDWKTEIFKEFTNLQPGNYVFKVKAINIYKIESKIAEFKFTIKPPWYRTTLAYIIYSILIILIIYLIIKIYTRRLVLEKINLEKLVSERTIEILEKNVELLQQKEEILAQRDLLVEHHAVIQEKNKNITASISYAKRIQEAMLPLESKIKEQLNDYFILFKPRDIVSGDFYWFAEKDEKIIFTAVDCTGHGVPGAFMSMIGSQILTTIIRNGITDAAEILNLINKYIQLALKQDKTENKDGMDMALCVIDKEKQIVDFAGAKNPLLHIYNGELFHYKGDKQAIGGYQITVNSSFTKQTINYKSPSYFYAFSDGFPDQFGGEKARKFMIKNLKDLILEIHLNSLEEQKNILNTTIENWMKGHEQTDDILVIGFKL